MKGDAQTSTETESLRFVHSTDKLLANLFGAFSYPDLMALLLGYDHLASMPVYLMVFYLKSIVTANWNPQGMA